MKKIAIIELARHAEVARAYIRIAMAANDAITVVTNQDNHDKLKPIFELITNIEWIVMDTHIAYGLKQLKKQLCHHDVLIYCTPEGMHGEVIEALFPAKSYLVIHDVNNYFNIHKNIDFTGGWKQYLRIMKYWALGYFRKRMKALHTFKGIIVPSTAMGNEVQRLSPSTKVFVIPFLYNEMSAALHSRLNCRIAIPGSVNFRSRDYHRVFEILHSIAKKKSDLNITLILLGKSALRDQVWINRSKEELANVGVDIIFYKTTIGQKLFDQEILQADFFWLPLQHKWTYGVINEVGGQTCLSGNIGDMVRYGMPALIPQAYNLEDGIQSMVFRYEDDKDTAATSILTFIDQKQYNTIKFQSPSVLKSFNEWIIGQYEILIDR